jgi:hypothetical protein
MCQAVDLHRRNGASATALDAGMAVKLTDPRLAKLGNKPINR